MNRYCINCMNKIENDAQVCPYCNCPVNGVNIPMHHLAPGTMLSNKFLVGRAIGEGGFGITYIGRDTNLDMKVAIKEYFPTGYVNRINTVSQNVSTNITEERKKFFDSGKERFLKEARVLARFSGKAGIVDVRDFFQENETAYIVMEYLDGQTLKSYLKQRGRISPEEAVNLLMPVMIALKEVHRQGLIHRDISPDNIMLSSDAVKLLDFGAARNVSANADKSLSVVLKAGYAPEEQYRSKGNQGPWTDVYAISATLYKCITGIVPDESNQRAFFDDLKAPSALGIRINPVIEAALMKGLGVLQKDRYQSMDELINGLKGNVPIQPAPVNSVTVQQNTNTMQSISKKQNTDSQEVKTEKANVYEPQKSNESVKPVVEDNKFNEAKKPKSLKKIIIPIIAGVAVCIITVVVFLIANSNNSSSNLHIDSNSVKNESDSSESSSYDVTPLSIKSIDDTGRIKMGKPKIDMCDHIYTSENSEIVFTGYQIQGSFRFVPELDVSNNELQNNSIVLYNSNGEVYNLFGLDFQGYVDTETYEIFIPDDISNGDYKIEIGVEVDG